MKRIATILFVVALAISPMLALAEEGRSLEEVVVQMADTPAAHAALADHYRARAEEARADARRHESMGRAYSAGKLTQRQSMKKHCTDISQNLSTIAADYDALAKVHDQAAKQ